MSKKRKEYTGGDLVRMSDLEHVRKRPGMYIGGLGAIGRLNLLLILMDDALTQVLAGEVKNIWVTVFRDGSWSFANDGKGIPVEKHENASKEMERDISVLEAATALLRYGSFERNRYRMAGGLIGLGLSVVNSLSDSFEVKVRSSGEVFRLAFNKGVRTGSLEKIESVESLVEFGTQIVFKPDSEIFEGNFIEEQMLVELLPIFAGLFHGVTIHFSSEVTKAKTEFSSASGAKEFFSDADSSGDPRVFATRLLSVVSGPKFGWANGTDFKYEKSEVVFRFRESVESFGQSFCNGYQTIKHGAHVDGFRKGFLTSLRELGESSGSPLDRLDDSQILDSVDFVVSVFLNQPQFLDQERQELANLEIVEDFSKLTEHAVSTFFDKSPDELLSVFDYLLTRQKS